MKMIQKLSALILAAAMALTAMTGCGKGAAGDASGTAGGAADSTENKSASSADVIAIGDLAETLGAGWNYGNTLEAIADGVVSETAWGNPAASQEMMDAVAAAGFKTVRVPVSWIDKIDDANGYKVDEAWLSRVEEVVQYAYNAGLNVIINVHGDGYNSIPGGWLLVNGDDQEGIREKYKALWTQIAERFADYDEHLIFEGMNEVFDGEYHDPPKEYYENLNAFDQTFVDAVRATGGNNGHRWLLVPGWNTDIEYTCGDYGFELPEDKNTAGEGRLILSVHYYAPWDYAGDENQRVFAWGDKGQELIDAGIATAKNTASYGGQDDLIKQMDRLKTQFVDQGVPVIIGEYGCIDKSFANLDAAAAIDQNRAYFDGFLAGTAADRGITPVYWDNGYNGNYGFALFDRSTTEQTHPNIIEAIVKAVAEKDPTAGMGEAVAVVEHETKDAIHAYLGIQTKVYTFRNGYDDGTYGHDSEWFDTLIKWEDTDGDGQSDIVDTGATLQDAEIREDGTYTVGVSGYDFSADSDGLNMLYVSTDFPYTGKMRITDVTLKIDGQEIAIDKPIISSDGSGNVYIEILNIYNEMAPNPTFDLPKESLEISFTLGNVKSAF